MGTIAISGAAGGIGRATRTRLEAKRHRVVGIDVQGTEVVADLSTAGGRRSMLRDVDDACEGVLDGLVVAAGPQGSDGPAVVSTAYFGALSVLEGLRPMLERAEGASVVVVCSNAMTVRGDYPLEVAEWCLAGDESRARQSADGDVNAVGAAADLALALWARRQATTRHWIGSGIRLNAVSFGAVDNSRAPGAVDGDAAGVEAADESAVGVGAASPGGEPDVPVPVGRPGRMEEATALVTFLLGPEAGFFCGSLITMDGGAEAALRPDGWPRPIGH